MTISIVTTKEAAMSTIGAGEFKAKCLHILDEVNRTRVAVTVTKRGKPIALVVPMPAEPGSSYGIAKGTISYAKDDDLLSTMEVWDADQ
jgi:prevent-host-death family protein